MAELADARDLKSRGPKGRPGSIPGPGNFVVSRPSSIVSRSVASRAQSIAADGRFTLPLPKTKRIVPRNGRARLVSMLLAIVAGVVAAAQVPQAPLTFDPLRDSLARDEAQAVYGPDVTDPWNQIFYLLFTRQIRSQLLVEPALPARMAPETLALSERRVTRIESGDRAIDPLYPSWTWMGSSAFDMSPDSRWRILLEPRYPQFLKALKAVTDTAAGRPPVARALMQADLWAVYDMLHAIPLTRSGSRGSTPDAIARTQRIEELMPLLARAIGALALTRPEIEALPDNYAAGARVGELPALFSRDSGWMEIRSFHERMHERAVMNRRVTRVFVKPAVRLQSEAAFLEELSRGQGQSDAVSAAALVIQVLLIAADGAVVPSSITYEVQIRTAASDTYPEGRQILQYELSRRRLLFDPRQSGLIPFDDLAPAYLPIAGNDLSFATPPRMDGDPVVVPLRGRCGVCHGDGLGQLFSFATIERPRVERLPVGEPSHARDVAARKMTREDFRSLKLAATRH